MAMPGRPTWSAKPVDGRPVGVAWGVPPLASWVAAAAVLVKEAGSLVGVEVLVAVGMARTGVLVTSPCGFSVGATVREGSLAASSVCWRMALRICSVAAAAIWVFCWLM